MTFDNFLVWGDFAGILTILFLKINAKTKIRFYKLLPGSWRIRKWNLLSHCVSTVARAVVCTFLSSPLDQPAPAQPHVSVTNLTSRTQVNIVLSAVRFKATCGLMYEPVCKNSSKIPGV